MMSFLLMHGIANPPIQMQMEVSLHPQLFTTRLLGVAGNDHPPTAFCMHNLLPLSKAFLCLDSKL